MTDEKIVELEGHIIDSGIMQRAFAIIMDMGGAFNIEQFDVGTHKNATTYCRMSVSAESSEILLPILHELHQNGATVADPKDATLESPTSPKVVPRGFYSTTNHPTDILYKGSWISVENIEMDTAIVVDSVKKRAFTKVLNSVDINDLIVTGEAGIRVKPPSRPRDSMSGPFGFMQGGVSSERPSESLIKKIAMTMKNVKENGGKILVVPGPAVIHSGAGDDLSKLVREGYVDMLSAGNGFAVHDLERNLYGTSLGMNIKTLAHPRKGHKHHIYTISEIVRAGSIKEAVNQKLITGGVMYECIENDIPYVLAGSIRDDGPLPDTLTDTVEAQNAIREQAQKADLVLMLSTLLHSVAVGNCLPSTTPTVCVDINPATVTQLLDRGSSHALGVVTDVGMFVPSLSKILLEN
jgi:lysine-ketoglutarate reductase/saccharopine dehydrogenase-like protein (TIGR00300 family)